MNVIFQPIYDLLFRILNLTSGPAVLISVLTSIFAIGALFKCGEIGRKIVSNIFANMFILTGFAAIICLFVYRDNIVSIYMNGSNLAQLLNIILYIVPNDIIAPFMSGDTPALIFLGIIIGVAILPIENHTTNLKQIILQSDKIIRLIMGWIGMFLPYFIFIILVFQDPLPIFLQLYKPLIIFICICALIMIVSTIKISVYCKVPVRKLLYKIKDTFWIAFKNCSASDAYEEIRICCQHKLGINVKVSEHSIPLGLVIFMPIAGISFMIFSFHLAQYYGIYISLASSIILIVLSVFLSTASPSIPAVNTMAYIVIFKHLRIPLEALMFTLVADAIFAFLFSAMNAVLLEYELLLIAKKSSLCNEEILNS